MLLSLVTVFTGTYRNELEILKRTIKMYRENAVSVVDVCTGIKRCQSMFVQVQRNLKDGFTGTIFRLQ